MSYVNKSRRINWGLQVDRLPYVTGGFSSGVTTVNGQQTYIEQTMLYRQVESGVSAQAFYPFDTTLRVEVGSGFRNIGFETRTLTDGFSIAHRTADPPGPAVARASPASTSGRARWRW